MGDEVRVTVIAAGFDRWDEGKAPRAAAAGERAAQSVRDLFGDVGRRRGRRSSGDDDFDVPSFLK